MLEGLIIRAVVETSSAGRLGGCVCAAVLGDVSFVGRGGVSETALGAILAKEGRS